MGEERAVQHVFHRKPPDFRGTVIYPLTRLEAVHPDLFEAAVAKYRGREWLMDEVIPLLGVRGKDVVNCAPIHPHAVYAALRRCDPQPVAAREWFAIPVERLRPHRVVYFKHRFLPPPPPRNADDSRPGGLCRRIRAVRRGAIPRTGGAAGGDHRALRGGAGRRAAATALQLGPARPGRRRGRCDRGRRNRLEPAAGRRRPARPAVTRPAGGGAGGR
jgi:hypothetical protein